MSTPYNPDATPLNTDPVTGATITSTTDTTPSGKLVTGLFPDRDSAEAAYNAAHARGYSKDDMNLVMSDETRNRHFATTTAGRETELGNKAAEGAGIGGAIGGTIGAIAAAIPPCERPASRNVGNTWSQPWHHIWHAPTESAQRDQAATGRSGDTPAASASK